MMQVADRMDIVQQALKSRPHAYTDAGSLLRLARLMGVAHRSQEVGAPSTQPAQLCLVQPRILKLHS